MTQTHYARGRGQETRLKEKLERDGYWVMRAAGSKGKADLVAIKKGQILLIQCKLGDDVPVKDWNELYELARGLGAEAIWCGRGLVLRRLLGYRRPRSSLKPWEPFTADSVASSEAGSWDPAIDATG